MDHCYQGTVLHVDLSKGDVTYEHPSEIIYRTYGGGSAMGMVYILKNIPAKIDAFSPRNTLTMFVGLPTGLPISGQSRLCVNAISPLTGGIGDSQSGGFFPAALKQAGFDGIVIHGKSSKPVYLFLDRGKAELRSAEHLWGKTTAEVDDLLAKDLEGKIEILQTGIAGEKLSRLASIMNMHTRANGRTGLGAVMGSKNLKAVVVRGKLPLAAADPQTLSRINREGVKSIPASLDVNGLGKNGTADVVVFQNSIGSLPTRNYNEGTYEGFEEITGDRMTETILVGRDTCFACAVRCKRVVETEFRGEKVLPTYGGPEYETLATFGSYCGISDLSAIALANHLCNMYGLDTIGAGATLSFAMECFQNGLITLEDTGGIELTFGNATAAIAMLKKIAFREGLGNLLAEGSAKAAERIGKNATDYLTTVKNAESPAHMPQAKKSLGLIYAVNPFGADHQSSEHDPMYEEGASELALQRLALLGLNKPQPEGSMNEEKVRFAYLTQVFYSALDSYCLCQFVWGPAWTLYGPGEMVEMLKAATGWDVTLEEVMKVGERRLNMMRMINARMGLTRRMDTLPAKFFKPLQGEGPTSGVSLDEKEMEMIKDTYYRMAGWDLEDGNPGKEKLTSLGLAWAAN